MRDYTQIQFALKINFPKRYSKWIPPSLYTETTITYCLHEHLHSTAVIPTHIFSCCPHKFTTTQHLYPWFQPKILLCILHQPYPGSTVLQSELVRYKGNSSIYSTACCRQLCE
ncbi:hypothetical protein Bhyg_04457 [Pseudolycoriella hygida]|uniref:Uncharacterized protein n=1 Tax=Pseudolycoriella hygida TaxID=35572 RepID=A0A9Q0S9L7_9DIPT|nr:hypothetical protein Bhyg_04457 [Pseudolycoriella hygida]